MNKLKKSFEIFIIFLLVFSLNYKTIQAQTYSGISNLPDQQSIIDPQTNFENLNTEVVKTCKDFSNKQIKSKNGETALYTDALEMDKSTIGKAYNQFLANKNSMQNNYKIYSKLIV